MKKTIDLGEIRELKEIKDELDLLLDRSSNNSINAIENMDRVANIKNDIRNNYAILIGGIHTSVKDQSKLINELVDFEEECTKAILIYVDNMISVIEQYNKKVLNHLGD